ncbi:LPXTG cell wall anchor domain-containing protein [Bilifractor porci]|nr:LPXTG cell wall anchor domain-containing protein [Bilifractor porci]
MKKIIKTLCMFSLAICLLALYVSPTYADGVKKLYFEQQDGKMVWNNVRGDDGNWFMSFTNMVPGGQYSDQLDIENGSRKIYALYMQVLPVPQDEKKDELLELISMKVTFGAKTLYQGTASGKEYDSGNLRNVIYLGTYQPGKADRIQVELGLDKNVGLEYSDLLTKNDWKFMVTEVQNPKKPNAKPNPPQTLQPPKTGDTSNPGLFIAILACAGFLVMLGASKKKKV